MYEASGNFNCAYNSTVCIQTCEYKNGSKGVYIFSVSITFSCAVSNLMFPSGEYCHSAADHK